MVSVYGTSELLWISSKYAHQDSILRIIDSQSLSTAPGNYIFKMLQGALVDTKGCISLK